MRQKVLEDGASELSYEIRDIVKKAEKLQHLGREIYWENIGDPIQKNFKIPTWMKDTISAILQEDNTYGYSHSKGVPGTRDFLAKQTNQLNGVQISKEDILFFNGLGDAISTLYQYIDPTSRVIGPSPSYSTHSSAEAAHARQAPITYKLDPDNNWYPDLDDLYNKVKYNPAIVGILIINPDNPTGMVYPLEILERIVAIAREFDLFLISDEIYAKVTYNGQRAFTLAEYLGDVPGIAMKGISKDFPWPGSRCGWVEFYNRENEPDFDQFCRALENAKMIEVCSTKLPQLAIPKVLSDPRFPVYRQELNERIGKRSKLITEILGTIPQLKFNETKGAFYNAIIFEEGVLKPHQKLQIEEDGVRQLAESWVESKDTSLDKRFVYYLLAAKGICVVPISSFCSELQGFRITLLEENEDLLSHIFTNLKEAILEYLES
ncbi:pyridoxal phosphate-dependent aminotransferase [Xanthovirga aplysinae]|uniref:pyridoxal phosphate-dependent aminotransferase n=1 Tax=Xanthovirga aplysinae TaxID=2529853 RepID=UPI0012BC9718|nr:pyridoxal phosphate-dependent aminotransferase [Xanthovirga aplysinae]MTI29625.1 pyridoxal phosphate-dependent aminotransferase [Xanthovirga aplysinae]